MERHDPRPAWEATFRETMTALRNGQEMSQTALADRLRARGLTFHQQTVAKIESGERPVRLDEAYLIAEELGASVDRMVRGAVEEVDLLKEGVEDVRSAYDRIKAATYELLVALSFLEVTIKDERERGRREPGAYLMPMAFLNYTPADAVQAGLAQAKAERVADELISRYTPDAHKASHLHQLWQELRADETDDDEHREAT